jgi:peptidoglycan hydrolase-like protein with peptidoglycan-binding domain
LSISLPTRSRRALTRAGLLGTTALATLGVTAPVAGASGFGARTLRPGMSGPDVKTLQRFLNMAGYRQKVDGSFGRATYKRVVSFEYQQELKPDGIVDRPEAHTIYRAARKGPSGGVAFQSAPSPGSELPPVPGAKAKLMPDGTAVAPEAAPAVVKRVIAAGNRIAFKPYVYGGGHNATFSGPGYDCSGSVSYALHGGGLLKSPLPSGSFASYGAEGPGKWISLYYNGGHMYAYIAGLRFDTSGASQDGSRWHKAARSNAGFDVVHPFGY